MCGLCGEFRRDHQLPDLAALARMSAALAPRGPDAAGFHQQQGLAVAHRRLKIIDLSEHAQQPMIDSELGLGLVFNGMLYNYRELRAELRAAGYRFFSHGDTEVLLKAYHHWGERCVERLQGMFAFALWERDRPGVLLGRDRLGIKPLYYAEIPGGVRFASTLPALLAGGGLDTTLDPVALHHYLSFHAVVPAPHTLLAGVRKVPPGCLLRLDEHGVGTPRAYWELPFGPRPGDEGKDLEAWRDEVGAALRTAVRRRQVADVPVGVLLSGGLDSSLIVGLLAEGGQTGLQTFSVGFEAVGEVSGDEFEYSDLIAQTFDTEHHRIRVPTSGLLEALADCVDAMAEPMVSHDVIGFYLLAREVARHIKVVQSGQGADEVFGGYHWYPPLAGSARPVRDYRNAFLDRGQRELCAMLHPHFHGKNHSGRLVSAQFAAPGAADPVDKALRLDTRVMLVDDPVKRVDNMTMAWGVEARVPFLDHELVELAARIPSRFKLADGGKGVLKAFGRTVIPPAVIDRPKGYFPVPGLKYLRGAYLDFVREILAQPQARERQLFDPGYVAGLLADPERQITPLGGSKLWQVALLEFWLQRHGIAGA
ncbi:MAG TPA: N-acetylglutaminylglutamine amidotransferase [Gammaproteobacteria bacterium]